MLMKNKTSLTLASLLMISFVVSCQNEIVPEFSNDFNELGSGTKVYATAKKSGSIKGDGVYSDQTELYMSETQPSVNQTVRIKLRTYKDNVQNVSIIMSNGNNVPMKKDTVKDKLSIFEYWIADVNSGASTSRYKFKLQNGNDTGWYNAVGFYSTEPDNEYSFLDDSGI
jgi:hypothetical protein